MKLELVLAILTAIESGGNPRAFNAAEDAVGILQIRPIMVQEVNRILMSSGLPGDFTLDDRWDPEKSRMMASVYLRYYTRLQQRLGNKVHPEQYALLWCAGPDGPTQAMTPKMTEYVQKFVKLIPEEV